MAAAAPAPERAAMTTRTISRTNCPQLIFSFMLLNTL